MDCQGRGKGGWNERGNFLRDDDACWWPAHIDEIRITPRDSRYRPSDDGGSLREGHDRRKIPRRFLARWLGSGNKPHRNAKDGSENIAGRGGERDGGGKGNTPAMGKAGNVCRVSLAQWHRPTTQHTNAREYLAEGEGNKQIEPLRICSLRKLPVMPLKTTPRI